MPPEDIETLRAEYELLNRNEWEGAFASAPADFALKTPAESGPHGGAATSREGARRVYGEFFAGFDEVEFEAEEFFDHDGGSGRAGAHHDVDEHPASLPTARRPRRRSRRYGGSIRRCFEYDRRSISADQN